MYDARIDRRVGDARPVHGDIYAVLDGTVMVQPLLADNATPGPTYRVVAPDGSTKAQGMCDGYDPGALSKARVWWTPNTEGWDPGVYSVYLTASAVGSDGITRQYVIAIRLRLLAAA